MDERFSRQILFKPIGKDGQLRLSKSRVLLIGCGALGASHAEMLARAGVGELRIVDRDFVEFSNLQRQTLYKESDAADRIPKAIAAKNRLNEINSGLSVDAVVADINQTNIESLIDGCDIIVDGSDNFQVRYLVNDASVKYSIPWVYGAAVSSYGSTITIRPGVTPCLRCVFEEIPDAGSSPTCDTAGVIMPIISTISAVQVTETIKLLTGNIDSLHGSLLQFDLWQNDWRKIKLREPNSDCVCCIEKNFEFLDNEDRELFTTLCGRDAVQISAPRPTRIDLGALAEKLRAVSTVKSNEYLVRFSADNFEITVFSDARAIIKGTDDLSVARSLYAKFIGT